MDQTNNLKDTMDATMLYRFLDPILHSMDSGEPVFRDFFGIRWKNPDNISGGRLGTLFFLLELYNRSRDDKTWNALTAELERLESYAGSHPTNNHTLFCGRLGIAYFYLQLYKVTGDKEYLQSSLTKVGDYFSHSSFHYNIINSYSLYDGIAGILLMAFCLYEQTNEPWLFKFIDVYSQKLVCKANTGAEGIYWGGLTDLDKRNIGFATGASGIAFALSRVGKYFGNKGLLRVAEQAFDHEDRYWNPEQGSWTQSASYSENTSFGRCASLAYGSAGMALARLNVYDLLDRPDYVDRWHAARSSISGWVDRYEPESQEISLDILSGWSGAGLACLQAYGKIQDKDALALAARIADIVSVRLDNRDEGETELLNAWGGASYFLLKMGDGAAGANDFYFMPGMGGDAVAITAPSEKSFLGGGNRPIAIASVSRDFRLSYACLEKKYPLELEAFLQRPEKRGMPDFEHLVRASIPWPRDEKKEFWDNFERECYVLSIKRAIDNVQYLDETEELFNIQDLMVADESLFFSTELVLSDRIWLFSRDAIDPLDSILRKEELLDFFKAYGMGTFYYRVNAVDQLEETVPAGISKLILDRFATAQLPGNACQQILDFICRQGEEAVDMLRVLYLADSKELLLKKIRKSVLGEIKGYLMEGILQIAGY